MTQLLISRNILIGFLEALEKKDLKNWYNQNQEILERIANHLKKVQIPTSNREKEYISHFICNSFLVLFTINWDNNSSDLRSDTVVGQFLLKLRASYDSNQWHQFYEFYKNYFDSLIHLAREKNIVDIRIEDSKGKKCLNFHEAKENNDSFMENDFKLAENGNDFGEKLEIQIQNDTKKSSSWFCCSTSNTPRERKTCKNADIVTRQPVFEKQIKLNADLKRLSSKNAQQTNGIEAKESRNVTSNKQKLPKETETFLPADIQEFENQLKTIVSSTNTREEKWKIPVDHERPAVHRTPSQTSYSSADWEKRRNEMDSSFKRKLKEQNEMFAEKLRKLRENRERLNREAEEDMRQFRKESALRIQMLLRCIQLRIRWEDQEQEWGDWLKSVRGPVVKVKNAFFELNGFRRYDDEEENRSDVMDVQRCIQNAYDKLTHEFGNLAMLSEQYEDKLFLKVLQKRISQVATKLCILMEDLDEFQNNASFFARLQQQQSQIDSMEIPTTFELRRICKNASPEEYNFIPPPKHPKSYCVITEI